MDRPLEEMLEQVAEETFESTAYMLSMGQDDAFQTDGDEWQAVRVRFSGPLSGWLVTWVSIDMLSELTCNMLGVSDRELPPIEKQQDLLKYVANVLCDNVLSHINGNGAVFNIDTPAIVEDPEAALPEGKAPAAKTRLYLDGGQAEVALLFDGPVPQPARAV